MHNGALGEVRVEVHGPTPRSSPTGATGAVLDLLPEYALRGRFAKYLPPRLLRGSDASPFVRRRAFRIGGSARDRLGCRPQGAARHACCGAKSSPTFVLVSTFGRYFC